MGDKNGISSVGQFLSRRRGPHEEEEEEEEEHVESTRRAEMIGRTGKKWKESARARGRTRQKRNIPVSSKPPLTLISFLRHGF